MSQTVGLIIFLGVPVLVLIGLYAFVIVPVILSQRKQEIKLNQLTAIVKDMKDHQPKPTKPDDRYMEAVERDFQHAIRRNSGKKKRK